MNKEKEREAKLKELRLELEDELAEQLPAAFADEKTRVEVEKIDPAAPLEPEKAKSVIEALLFASSRPLTISEIKKVVKSLSPSQIEGILQELKEDYARQNRAFELIEIAGGCEIATQKEFAPWIFRLEMQKKAKAVTQSALESLAILAYKQPVTRAEIEDLRGVDVSGVLTTLVERGLVKIVGKKEIPGRPFLYGTTDKFLEHFGLKSLAELPNISEIKALVENSVKKEELLGTTKIVEVTQEESNEPERTAAEN